MKHTYVYRVDPGERGAATGWLTPSCTSIIYSRYCLRGLAIVATDNGLSWVGWVHDRVLGCAKAVFVFHVLSFRLVFVMNCLPTPPLRCIFFPL